MFIGEPFGSHSALTLFPFFCQPLAFIIVLSVSYLLDRGAVGRKEDTGESWSGPEPHSGGGSYSGSDSKRVHIHSTYGLGL